MASFVGSFKVVTNSGQIIIGDSHNIAPNTTSNTINGSGSGTTGDFAASINYLSWTNVDDTHKKLPVVQFKNNDGS